MRRSLVALVLLTCLGPVSASAEDAAGCAKFKWSIARERSAFAAAGLPVRDSGQTLPGVSVAAAVKLRPQTLVTFVHAPGRTPKVDPSHAAVLTMPLTTSGTYQVTLSDEAWIDVLQDDKEVRSSGFSGQTECPGVRKSVKFALHPGPATIQISGASTESIDIEVLPVE